MTDKAVEFGCRTLLIGIVSEPDSRAGSEAKAGVIFLNAGLRHRIGPKRWYVTMARRLAASGHTVLRFDFSGVGDSPSRSDSMPAEESAVDEVREGMDYLGSKYGLNEFIIIGLCRGGDAAFATACADRRVVGAVLIDGYYLSNDVFQQLAPRLSNSLLGRRTKVHLFNWNSWRRILTRPDDFEWVKRHLALKIRGMHPRRRLEAAQVEIPSEWGPLLGRGVELLMVYSEGSAAVDTYRLVHSHHISGLAGLKKPRVEIVPDTDHEFTLLWSQKRLLDMVCEWMSETRFGCSPESRA